MTLPIFILFIMLTALLVRLACALPTMRINLPPPIKIEKAYQRWFPRLYPHFLQDCIYSDTRLWLSLLMFHPITRIGGQAAFASLVCTEVMRMVAVRRTMFLRGYSSGTLRYFFEVFFPVQTEEPEIDNRDGKVVPMATHPKDSTLTNSKDDTLK